MKVLKSLAFFILLSLVVFAPNGRAVVVLKVKNKQALIHLEGLKTKRGAYFEVVDLYGKKRGLVQIKKTARTKAIGVLKQGSMVKMWSLEPISAKKAIAMQKRAKRAVKIARIQKEKIRRRLAGGKSLRRQAQRKIAQRKRLQRGRAGKRRPASYGGEEYILSDLPETSDQSDEVLGYDSFETAQDESLFPEEGENSQDGGAFSEAEDSETAQKFILGLTPHLEYNFMKVVPDDKDKAEYFMRGLGYGGFLFIDAPLNRFLRAKGSLGYTKFEVSAPAGKCGKREGCSVLAHYLSAGLNLKLKFFDFNSHNFWLALGGRLLQPLAYSNNVLTQESFSPFHGNVGLELGADWNMGRFAIPISLRGNLYMPPTKTIIAGTVELNVGLGYKL